MMVHDARAQNCGAATLVHIEPRRVVILNEVPKRGIATSIKRTDCVPATTKAFDCCSLRCWLFNHLYKPLADHLGADKRKV